MIRDALITLACAFTLAILGLTMLMASRKRALNREASDLLSAVAIALFFTAVFGVCAMVAP